MEGIEQLAENAKAMVNKAMSDIDKNLKNLSEDERALVQPYIDELKSGKTIDIKDFTDKINNYASRSNS